MRTGFYKRSPNNLEDLAGTLAYESWCESVAHYGKLLGVIRGRRMNIKTYSERVCAALHTRAEKLRKEDGRGSEDYQ